MQEGYIQRDIDDMNALVEELAEIADVLEGVIKESYVDLMRSVTNEWNRDTKPRLEEMIEKLDNELK